MATNNVKSKFKGILGATNENSEQNTKGTRVYSYLCRYTILIYTFKVPFLGKK